MPILHTPVRVRWWIFLYTFLFALLTYVQHNSLSIAAERIMPELHLSQMQVWSFLYLVQERHLSALEGGWLAMLPPIGAAVGAWLGGGLADWFAARFGVRWGYRIVPLVTLPLAGALLLVATGTGSVYVAVGALTLAFAGIESNEGPYWAATMSVARADTMAASGVLNTGGNLGGVINIPIIAWLSGHGHWHGAFATGTGFAVVAAALWLLIDADRQLETAATVS